MYAQIPTAATVGVSFRPRPRETLMRRTTVLLADDHTIVTEGLAGLLAKHDFDVVGAVGDGHYSSTPPSGFAPT